MDLNREIKKVLLNQILIGMALFRMIRQPHQTKFRLVSNQSEKLNSNPDFIFQDT